MSCKEQRSEFDVILFIISHLKSVFSTWYVDGSDICDYIELTVMIIPKERQRRNNPLRRY